MNKLKNRKWQYVGWAVLGVVCYLGPGLLLRGEAFVWAGRIPWIIGGVLLIVGLIRRQLAIPFAYAIGVGLSYVGIMALLFGGPVVSDYVQRRPFDADVWKTESDDVKNPVRLRMVDDLLHGHTLIGMAQGEIDALLGVPPETSYFQEYDYVYWLGPERGPFSIDSEWLVLKFLDGRVSEARLVHD